MTRPARTRLPYGSTAYWWRLLAGLLVLGLLELLTGHLIVDRLLGPTAAMAVDVVLGAVTVALVVVLASPLWASPYLTHDRTTLVVDLGLLGGARIPLADVTDVREYRPTAVKPVDPGAGITAETPPRGTFSRGGQDGFVSVRLARPVPVRYLVRRRASVTEIVLQSADPAAAVAAIRDATAAGTPRAG